MGYSVRLKANRRQAKTPASKHMCPRGLGQTKTIIVPQRDVLSFRTSSLLFSTFWEHGSINCVCQYYTLYKHFSACHTHHSHSVRTWTICGFSFPVPKKFRSSSETLSRCQEEKSSVFPDEVTVTPWRGSQTQSKSLLVADSFAVRSLGKMKRVSFLPPHLTQTSCLMNLRRNRYIWSHQECFL